MCGIGRRPVLIVGSLALAFASGRMAWAQAATADADASLRQAVSAFVAAWNQRDATAYGALLVEDVEWVSLYAQPKKGRDPVVTYARFAMLTYAVRYEVDRIRIREQGKATVLLKGQILSYPFKDGKYTRVFDREVVLSRWRLENGHWRIAYLNENVNQSADLAKAEGF